jgi:putative salt-induced outer membrane protein YdiY
MPDLRLLFRALLPFLALASLLVSSPAMAQEAASDPAAGFRALERGLADAMRAKDEARLDSLLAPDYVLRGSPDIDRATWIKNALTLCWGDRSEISEFEARPHAGVAVTSFVLTFYVDPDTCAPALLRSLITDVWVRGSTGWRLQVRHSAPPPQGGIAAQYGAVPEVPPVWDLKGELSLVATGGTTSVRTLGLGSTLVHRAGSSTTLGSVAFLTSEVDSVTNARSLTVLGRHGVRVGPRVEFFGEASYGRDRFAGIDNRFRAAAGAAYSASLRRRQTLTAEGSFGYTAENRLDATDRRFPTATGTLRYRWPIVPGTLLTEDAGVIADMGTIRNWRGTSATAFVVTLTRLVSFKVSHALEYRNDPVRGFGRTDLETTAALVVSLQRR